MIILGDDVGYGDLSCYGTGVVPTPNVDRLAGEGLRFTNAHCVAATSTPARYSMLTGEFASHPGVVKRLRKELHEIGFEFNK